MPSSLVDIQNLTKRYRLGKHTLTAIQDISLAIEKQETLGIVGESGSGKSTLGKCVLRLTEPSSGSIFFGTQEITYLSQKEMRPFRKQMQMIFQDPYSSLNPRMNVETIVGEGLETFSKLPQAVKKERIEELLLQVNLDPEILFRYPRELSGGQRQRIGIARALAVNPQLMICDEPTSSLDPYTQEQILQLLENLKNTRGLTYLLISHNLTVIQSLADRIAVMYLGKIVEEASAHDLFLQPQHPYTQALLAAVPIPDPKIEKTRSKIFLKGEIPSPFTQSKGCPFFSRCPHARKICENLPPERKQISATHFVSCHLVSKGTSWL